MRRFFLIGIKSGLGAVWEPSQIVLTGQSFPSARHFFQSEL